jgi:hypothetical protein
VEARRPDPSVAVSGSYKRNIGSSLVSGRKTAGHWRGGRGDLIQVGRGWPRGRQTY